MTLLIVASSSEAILRWPVVPSCIYRSFVLLHSVLLSSTLLGVFYHRLVVAGALLLSQSLKRQPPSRIVWQGLVVPGWDCLLHASSGCRMPSVLLLSTYIPHLSLLMRGKGPQLLRTLQ